MAYYKDFTVCGYFSGGDWLCRLIAVGWVEQGRSFETGHVVAEVTEKLQVLREEFEQTFRRILFRGLHNCSICKVSSPDRALLDRSHVNLFIPYRGFVFVAPGRIDHYIETHGYRPPESFMDAVLACPPPSGADYRELLTTANRGVKPPIYTYE
jgi:hypothetical protein